MDDLKTQLSTWIEDRKKDTPPKDAPVEMGLTWLDGYKNATDNLLGMLEFDMKLRTKDG